mmetsp:Transcript_24759/g.71548  ORF Transcript_24759/g.71548 Transcript_24759/m.71548 type:complete len:475 (+) Transcript_24759:111-1535(+)
MCGMTMAPSPGTCAVAGMHPQRLRLRLLLAIAAGIAAYIDAARLDRLAHDASTANGLMGAATNELASAQAKPPGVDKGDRDHDLRLLAGYVDSLNPNHPMSLSEIRVQATHLERVRSRVCNLFRDRDGRNRQMVRSILSNIRLKTDAFNRVAARKESEGELDDGGDVFPSLRDNICSGIDDHSDCDEFREQLRDLCKALDSVRAAVLAGEDHQAAVFEVNGRLAALRIQKEYAQSSVNWGVAVLLGEEWRWVTRQLARRGGAASDGDLTRSLEAWMTEVSVRNAADERVRNLRLQDAWGVVNNVHVDESLGLGLVRTHVGRLEMVKEMVVDIIRSSDPELLEDIRELLRTVKEKTSSLKALAKRKEAAGEVDDIGETLPSQRNNICKHLAEFGLEPDFSAEVRRLCAALDKWHTLVDDEDDTTVFEVLGRMAFMKRRSNYANTSIAGELETVLADEWGWIQARQAEREAMALST